MEIHAPYISAHTSFSRQSSPHKTQTLCQFPLSQNPNQEKSHAIPTLPRQNPLLRAREFQVLQGLPNHRSFLRLHRHCRPQWLWQIQPHGRHKLRPRRSRRPTPRRSTQRPHLRLRRQGERAERPPLTPPSSISLASSSAPAVASTGLTAPPSPGTSTMPSLGILEFSSRLAISSSFRFYSLS